MPSRSSAARHSRRVDFPASLRGVSLLAVILFCAMLFALGGCSQPSLETDAAFTQDVRQGVTLVSVRFPILADHGLTGSWGMAALRFRSVRSFPDAVITLSDSTGARWTVSQPLPAHESGPVRVFFPANHDPLDFSATSGSRVLAAGRIIVPSIRAPGGGYPGMGGGGYPGMPGGYPAMAGGYPGATIAGGYPGGTTAGGATTTTGSEPTYQADETTVADAGNDSGVDCSPEPEMPAGSGPAKPAATHGRLSRQELSIIEWDWAARCQPEYVAVGKTPDFPFPSMADAEMEALAKYPQSLDRVLVMVVDGPAKLAHWRSERGIDDWIAAGGLLVAAHGSTSFHRYGAGAVAGFPGVPFPGDLDRLVLSLRGGTVLWQNASIRDGNRRPGSPGELEQASFPESVPPYAVLALVLLAYLAMLLPANYFVLRFLGRKELSWYSIPLIAMTGCAVIYGVCCATEGVAPRVGRLSVVEQDSPGVFTGIGYTGVFAPTRGLYTVHLPAGALPQAEPDIYNNSGMSPARVPVNRTIDEQPGGPVVRVQVNQWSSRTLQYAFRPQVAGSITGSVSYSPSLGWTATIRNDSSLRLEECRVDVANFSIDIGKLDPGARVTRRSRPAAAPSDPPETHDSPPPWIASFLSGPQSFEERTRRENTHYERGVGPYLVGWTRQALQPAAMDGQAAYLDETRVEVPLSIVPTEDGFWVPDGAVPQAAISSSSWNGVGMGLASRPGVAIHALQLPASARTVPGCVLDLDFSLEGDTISPVTVAAWKASERRWITLPRLRINRNSMPRARLRDLARFLDSPSGHPGPDSTAILYLRVSRTGSTGTGMVSDGRADRVSASLLGSGCSWPPPPDRSPPEYPTGYPGPTGGGRG